MELPTDRETWLRVECVRIAWDHKTRETDLEKSILLQLFAVLVSAALTGVATVVIGTVPVVAGLVFVGAMLAGSGVVHLKLRRLRPKLRSATDFAIQRIQSLMKEDVE